MLKNIEKGERYNMMKKKIMVVDDEIDHFPYNIKNNLNSLLGIFNY
jgi:hypothetical protein